MDRQIYIDRLLETENLTDNLEDDDANALIKWGIAQVDALMQDASDPDSVDLKVQQLIDLMRQINRIAGNPSTISAEEVTKFLDYYAQTFDEKQQVSEKRQQALAEKLSKMQPGEIVNYLLGWKRSKKQS